MITMYLLTVFFVQVVGPGHPVTAVMDVQSEVNSMDDCVSLGSFYTSRVEPLPGRSIEWGCRPVMVKK